ncbi:MAG: SDR family NAD(P)-dependent oxidoreductase [Opitutales bacterium]|nr:SDR family NAD(P)-dependent oxidoreductase [Opitutales bacterium]
MKIQKVLITGGSRGMGLSLVKLFEKQVSEVHTVSRTVQLQQLDPNVFHHQCDLSSLSASEKFINYFIDEHGIPDLLINNAGSGVFFDWANFPIEEINKQINLLFTIPVMLCRKVAPLMADKRSGVILNLTSLATLYPLPFMPLYNAGKSALSAFTQSMLLEFDEYPKFIDFRMGDVNTDFNNVSVKPIQDKWSDPMKRAWQQIEKQLHHSPTPEVAANQILNVISKSNSGIYYGGGILQSKIAPFLPRFLSSKFLNKILRSRYNQ